MKGRTKGLLLGAGMVVAGAAVVMGRAAARGPNPRPALERVTASRHDLATYVKATGVVRPRVGAEVRVGSRASGVVKRLLVRVGDTVAPGQLLATLDARDLVARRDQAAASLESARASLAYATADLARKKRLAAERLLAPADLDLAERAHAVASTAETEARASLDYASTLLAYTEIRAPIGGVVASVSTQEGETVAASLASPTFVTLVDLSRLEVRAYVDETDIGRIRPGQEARFTVDTYAGAELEGRVETVYPQAEIRDNVVNYVTVVRFQPTEGHVLRPEMTATVRIALDRGTGLLTVPRRAVRREGGQPYVLVPKGDGMERRGIKTGRGDETWTEVTDGLKDGDVVLVGDLEPDTGETR